jgi:hypothetical protein
VLARALRWIREQVPFLTVAGGVGVGFIALIVAPDHWRAGTGIIAVALLAGALLRLFLHRYGAGLLAVRSRWVDNLAYLVLGGLILAVDIRLQS